ncbi:hypothetical protein RhiirB3_450675 [Rhizophagus irregularis]|nr:hypothetical protein RhiirB3_450675 [Rhizophagus irregularis]
MAEWTDPEIRTLIDKRRTRNDEFHNLGRNQKRFWSLPKMLEPDMKDSSRANNKVLKYSDNLHYNPGQDSRIFLYIGDR